MENLSAGLGPGLAARLARGSLAGDSSGSLEDLRGSLDGSMAGFGESLGAMFGSFDGSSGLANTNSFTDQATSAIQSLGSGLLDFSAQVLSVGGFLGDASARLGQMTGSSWFDGSPSGGSPVTQSSSRSTGYTSGGTGSGTGRSVTSTAPSGSASVGSLLSALFGGSAATGGGQSGAAPSGTNGVPQVVPGGMFSFGPSTPAFQTPVGTLSDLPGAPSGLLDVALGTVDDVTYTPQVLSTQSFGPAQTGGAAIPGIDFASIAQSALQGASTGAGQGGLLGAVTGGISGLASSAGSQIGLAIGTAVAPALGPVAPVVGQMIGSMVGSGAAAALEAPIEYLGQTAKEVIGTGFGLVDLANGPGGHTARQDIYNFNGMDPKSAAIAVERVRRRRTLAQQRGGGLGR